jgi:hypothetical protein
MTAVHGFPVAGLLMFKVTVNFTPGVRSVAVKLPLSVRYTADVIVTTSWIGFTVTETFVLAVSPEAELLAVTAKDKVLGAKPAGTVGARKVCCDPSLVDGMSVIP